MGVRGKVEPRAVFVYEGDRKLAEVTDGAATLPGLKAGIHPLHLRGETAEGRVLLSRPHTIIVE